jgi:branched-chain amino acid transport system substrate-binding protein
MSQKTLNLRLTPLKLNMYRCFNFLVSICLFLFLVASLPASSREIVVAQSLDLSGQTNLGKDYSNGLRTYFDAVNERGGVRGRRIVFLQLDDSGDPATTVANLGRLLRENRVDVLIAPTTANSFFAAIADPAFRNGNVGLVGAPTGARMPERDNPRVFHLRASYRDEARQLFTHMSTLGMRRLALVVAEGEESQFAAAAFRAEASARGATLVFDGDATQWRTGAGARSQAEAVIITGDAIGVAATVTHSRQVVRSATLFGFSMIDHRTLRDLVKSDAIGMVISQAMPAADKSRYAFQREHREQMKRFRDEPPSLHTLEGYLVARYLTGALSTIDADPTPVSVVSALRRSTELDLGALSITASASSTTPRFVNVSAISTRGELID